MEEEDATASSNVILKLPLSHLKFLRSDFESDEDGLSLDDFLLAMVEHTKFDNVEEIIQILPSMIDFFKDVDINGDGQMDWGEFTQSIIASIEKQVHVHNENLVLVADVMVQKPPAHHSCSCCAIVPELKRAFVCIQDDITMFGLNEQSSNLLTAPLKKMKLKKMNPTDMYHLGQDEAPKPADLVVEEQQHQSIKKLPCAILDARPLQTPYVLNICYIASLSVLCILRSDNSVEFLRLIVRANQSSSMSEAIEHLGVVTLGNAFTSCAVRDMPKHPVLFFATGCDHKTYYWNVTMKTSHILLSPQPRVLSKHSDYALDVLAISTDSYKVLVSCGMDKKIRMWDLATMHYKAFRSYVSGLLSLAFDSKSIVLAAACDCNIIGWDLDSQMDVPLFKLCGHLHPVHRIVGLGNVQRCVSLDSEGTVIYWDIKKGGIDDEERMIKDLHTASLDKLSTLGVFPNVSSRYKGFVMLAQGKQQHVYTIQDSTPNESPPITSLFTAELLMIISIHTKNIVQWNVLNGKQIKSFVYCPSTPNCELVCGVLADRNRKLITGDSLGNVNLYSCLSIQLLRRFAHFPYSIKHLTYCTDNNVICVCNPGKIFILDSSLNNVPDNSPEYVLRDVEAHSVDVMCMVFSRQLGLIATGDSDGIIKVWIYSTLMIDAVFDVKEITTTGDFSQMAFMEPYPLLLIPDVDNSVHIIAVGYAALKYGKKMWRVDTTCQLPRTGMTMSLSPKKAQSPCVGMNGEDTAHRRKQAIDQQNDREVGQIIEKYNKKKLHLTGTRAVTHMFVRQIFKDIVERAPSSSPESSPKKTHNFFTPQVSSKMKFDFAVPMLSTLGGDSVDSGSVCSSGTSVQFVELSDKATTAGDGKDGGKDGDNDSLASVEEDEEFIGSPVGPRTGNQSTVPTTLSNFVEDRDILLFYGYDDGTVAVIDLTPVMWEINLRALTEEEYVFNTYLYNSKLKVQRKVRPELVDRCSWTAADVERVRISTRKKALLESHWTAHLSNVVSMSIIGDKNYLLTSSEDSSIKMFTVEGEDVAVLTRGRTIDGILRTAWVSPIDIVARNERRVKEAVDFVKANAEGMKIMSRAVYITQQMNKRPNMFMSTNFNKLLASSEVFDENCANITTDKVFDVTSPPPPLATTVRTASFTQPSLDTFNSTFGGSFYQDADTARMSVLNQLSVDAVKRGDGFEGGDSAYEDDSDLEPLANSARGALNKAALLHRKKMVEKREKRYFASVTLDANELISDIANNAIMRGTTMSSFPSGMSSASVVEHQRQLEHNRLKIEAAKQASFRQKALYPSMYSEKMARQRLAELTTRTIKSSSSIVPDEGEVEKERTKVSRDVASMTAAVTAGVDTGCATTAAVADDSSPVLPEHPPNRIPPLDLGKTNASSGNSTGAGTKQLKKARIAAGSKQTKRSSTRSPPSAPDTVFPPAPISPPSTSATIINLAADSVVVQTFNLCTSEMFNSSSVIDNQSPFSLPHTSSGSAVKSHSAQFSARPITAGNGMGATSRGPQYERKERQALYNENKTNTSRSKLLISKVVQSKNTATLGEESCLNSLQNSLEEFDRKMNMVDYPTRLVMGGKKQYQKKLSSALSQSLTTTGIGGGIGGAMTGITPSVSFSGGITAADDRLQQLKGHHSHAALARIGSVVSVDGTTALNPSEVIEQQGQTLRRRDDILPTRNASASNFGAQMLAQHYDNEGSNYNSDDDDGGTISPPQETKWMQKVRSLLVLSETTDYLDSRSGSVNGDSAGLNIVDNFHDLADSALVDRSGKDRYHKEARRPKSPVDLNKKKSDRNLHLSKSASTKSMNGNSNSRPQSRTVTPALG